MTGLLLRSVELAGRQVRDVRLAGGRITEVGALARFPGEPAWDCRGAALLPGLCDHHLHLHALAAADRSVSCGPPATVDPAALGTALADAPADEHGWVRGIGYVESVAGELDAGALDRLHAGRPVRIQHRGGALWMLNGAALRHLGLAGGEHPGIERARDGTPTGRLWRADDWLRGRLPASRPPDLAGVGRRLAALGITAVTDATPDLAPEAIDAITEAHRSGALPQRPQLLGAPPGHPAAGPSKIVLADSGLPDLDALTERIRATHLAGRPVAAHCVTQEALVLLLAALDDAGSMPGDRIEHAALVPEGLLPALAASGLRVVTQPGFLADRGDDYLRDVPAEQHGDLYRCRSLLDAGVPLALSSDGPYGPLDPWAVIAAAVHRRTGSGAVVAPAERLTPVRALHGYLSTPGHPGGPARRITVGAAADLVLLHTPLAEILRAPRADAVRAVLIAGRPVTRMASVDG